MEVAVNTTITPIIDHDEFGAMKNSFKRGSKSIKNGKGINNFLEDN